MSSQTIVRFILTRMEASRGSVWSPKDFLDLGHRAAVDQALRRLTLTGRIRRVARGLYDYPQKGRLVGLRAPGTEATARAAARARGASLRPTGAVAANALGLSAQVPAVAEYITDGPAREIDIGGRLIRLKRVSPNRLALPDGAGALVEALRYLGKSSVRRLSDDELARVATILTKADASTLKKAMHRTPDWMRPTIDTVLSLHDSKNMQK